MFIAQQIGLWADKLRNIAAEGLRYSSSKYDTDRYLATQDTSMEMFAMATGQSVEELEPLRSTVFARISPITGGGGAVIDDDGRILLIQRADNATWAMPGGALEVGEAPAEGAVREVLEETGVKVRPIALIGIFDSRRCGSHFAHHVYHILFLCSPIKGNASATHCSHANEVLDVKWFAEDELPSNLCPGHGVRIPIAYRFWHKQGLAFFDAV